MEVTANPIPLHIHKSQGAVFVCGVSRCEEVTELSKSWFSSAAFLTVPTCEVGGQVTSPPTGSD